MTQSQLMELPESDILTIKKRKKNKKVFLTPPTVNNVNKVNNFNIPTRKIVHTCPLIKSVAAKRRVRSRGAKRRRRNRPYAVYAGGERYVPSFLVLPPAVGHWDH